MHEVEVPARVSARIGLAPVEHADTGINQHRVPLEPGANTVVKGFRVPARNFRVVPSQAVESLAPGDDGHAAASHAFVRILGSGPRLVLGGLTRMLVRPSPPHGIGVALADELFGIQALAWLEVSVVGELHDLGLDHGCVRVFFEARDGSLEPIVFYQKAVRI